LDRLMHGGAQVGGGSAGEGVEGGHHASVNVWKASGRIATGPVKKGTSIYPGRLTSGSNALLRLCYLDRV
jgi:hypothetical protein